MGEGVAFDYAKALQDSPKPTAVLGGLFRDIFERELDRSDWKILGRYVKIYGRWIVYEAIIKTAAAVSINTDSDGRSVWGYIYAVCNSLMQEESQRRWAQRFRDQERERTILLIQSLREPAIEITLTTEEDFNRGTDSK